MIKMFLNGRFLRKYITGMRMLPVLLCASAGAQNLVTNGDFEAGNAVGFSSNYTYIPAPTGTTSAGQYGIGKNPKLYNPDSFMDLGDHTSGSGNMMVVDGTNNGGNTDPAFWRINNNGEICGLTAGATYTFSYWVKAIYRSDIPGASRPDIGIKWNNVQGQSETGIIAPSSGNMVVPAPPADWQQVTYTFVPTHSCVRIEMFDRNSNLAGNDFAIDDIELRPPVQPLQIMVAPVAPGCSGGMDGFIAAYGRGGRPPYTYSFNGGPFTEENMLRGLGTVVNQNVTIRDAGFPAAEVSFSGISLAAPANPLDAGPNGSTCAGQPYTLNATGGSSYLWTAIPEDTSLTTPNLASPTVKPLVNTLYKVTSEVSSIRNLIFNGSFSEGDAGFATDYTGRVSNPEGLQGVYGVVPDAQAFFNGFAACSGSGGTGDPMFVADGSTHSDARIWCQKVPVQPNTVYVFSFAVQSLQTGSPALIETRINNLPITGNAGTSIAEAPLTTCNWKSVSYTWHSGADSVALICFYNRNLASGGNDFGLDNIRFTTTNNCIVSRQVTVNVRREALPTVSVTAQPNCNIRSGTITFTAPIGSDFQYSINGITYRADPVFTNVNPGSYQVRVKNMITGCVSNPRILSVNTVPPAPSAAVSSVTAQPSCNLPTGTIVISSPVGSLYEYSIDGVNYQSSPTFSGVNPGTYNIRTRNTITLCLSNSLGVVVNPAPGAPPVPAGMVTVPPSCNNSTGTLVFNTPLGSVYEYSIDGQNYQKGVTFSGLVPKTYSLRVRNTQTGCMSGVALVTMPAAPAVPPDPVANVTVQPDCITPSGTIVVNSPVGAGFSYSIDGVIFQEQTEFKGLKPGNYSVRVRDNNSGCIRSSPELMINALPLPPPAPQGSVTVQPDCLVPSGTLFITSPAGAGLSYSLDSLNWQGDQTFAGLGPGVYSIRVRNQETGCISNPSAFTVNSLPVPPAEPEAVVTVQPDCLNQTGTILITAPVGAGLTYSLNGTAWQDSTLFNRLAPGTYRVRVRHQPTGCISSGPSLFVNEVPPPLPVPQAEVTAQPTCQVPSGTLTVTSPAGIGIEYSLNGTNWQTTSVFSGLAPGSYMVTARNPATLCTSISAPLVVNPVTAAPAPPAATVTEQPGCSSPLGTILITAPTETGLEYSINGTIWQTGTVFNGLVAGTYAVRVRNVQTGCLSAATTLVVTAAPIVPALPVATVTEQPTCSIPAGTISISAPAGPTLEYSLNGVTWQSGTVFAGLSPGTYSLRVRNTAGGCISGILTLVVNTAPVAPPAPVASVSVQPGCTIGTGTIVIDSPTGPLLDYTVDDVNFQVGLTFSGLPPGRYPVRARNILAGCTGNPTILVVNPAPVSPPAPGVNSPVTHCRFATGVPPLSATGDNLKWYNLPSGGTGINNAPVPDATIAGSTTWYVSQTHASGCESPRAPITVNVVATPEITLLPKLIEMQSGQPVILPATVTGQGVQIRWSPSAGLNNTSIERPLANPDQTTTYTLVASTSQACSASDTVRVVVLKDIVVPNVFSPNGDGINDTWVIKHLADYPAASVEVYDRYGKPVYRRLNLPATWDGTCNGKPVPAGTYYYLIKPGNKKILSGSVTVLR